MTKVDLSCDLEHDLPRGGGSWQTPTFQEKPSIFHHNAWCLGSKPDKFCKYRKMTNNFILKKKSLLLDVEKSIGTGLGSHFESPVQLFGFYSCLTAGCQLYLFSHLLRYELTLYVAQYHGCL